MTRERNIQADRRSRSKLLVASENPFCAALGSQRAEVAEKGPAKHGKQDLTQTLAVTPLQAAIRPKVTPGRQGNATCLLRESLSVNGK